MPASLSTAFKQMLETSCIKSMSWSLYIGTTDVSSFLQELPKIHRELGQFSPGGMTFKLCRYSSYLLHSCGVSSLYKIYTMPLQFSWGPSGDMLTMYRGIIKEIRYEKDTIEIECSDHLERMRHITLGSSTSPIYDNTSYMTGYFKRALEACSLRIGTHIHNSMYYAWYGMETYEDGTIYWDGDEKALDVARACLEITCATVYVDHNGLICPVGWDYRRYAAGYPVATLGWFWYLSETDCIGDIKKQTTLDFYSTGKMIYGGTTTATATAVASVAWRQESYWYSEYSYSTQAVRVNSRFAAENFLYRRLYLYTPGLLSIKFTLPLRYLQMLPADQILFYHPTDFIDGNTTRAASVWYTVQKIDYDLENGRIDVEAFEMP